MNRHRHDDESVEPHAAIDLRGSRLLSLAREGTSWVADLEACVHRSRGTPGVDAGTSWVQGAAIVVERGESAGALPTPTCGIERGTLVTAMRVFHDLVVCPYEADGPVSLSLHLDSGVTVELEGDAIRVVFTGEPRFVEDVAATADDMPDRPDL